MTQQPQIPSPDDLPKDGADTASEGRGQPNTRTPLYEAYHAERYLRQDIIKGIQGHTARRLLCYVSGDGCRIDRDDTLPFNDLIYHLRSGEDIDLMLHTLGGSVDEAEKLIRLVRSKIRDGELRVIVPEFAKSAGTLMVLGADCVVMSDTSELGPIDPQMVFFDGNGNSRWQSVQNYLDAYEEYTKRVAENPDNVAAQIMLGKLDSTIAKLCEEVQQRARQSAEYLLSRGMFRSREGSNLTMTVDKFLDKTKWPSHSQMISWQDVQGSEIGLTVDYLDPHSDRWQQYWKLYCLQRLAIRDNQKLYESDYVSLVTDGPTR